MSFNLGEMQNGGTAKRKKSKVQMPYNVAVAAAKLIEL